MLFEYTERRIPEVMFVNCGHHDVRRIIDCRDFCFLSAGQGDLENRDPDKFGKQMRNLIVGDIACVYRSAVGYVGVAKITRLAMDINNAILNDVRVTRQTPFSAESNMFRNHDKPGFMEWLVEVKWLTEVYISDNPRISNNSDRNLFGGGLFANPSVVCSLRNQGATKDRIKNYFNLDFNMLLR